jgi:hypothetical protein
MHRPLVPRKAHRGGLHQTHLSVAPTAAHLSPVLDESVTNMTEQEQLARWSHDPLMSSASESSLDDMKSYGCKRILKFAIANDKRVAIVDNSLDPLLEPMEDEDEEFLLPNYPADAPLQEPVKMLYSLDPDSPTTPIDDDDGDWNMRSRKKGGMKSPRRKQIEAKARDKMRVASKRLREAVGPRTDGGAYRGTADVMERAAIMLE